MILGWGLCSDKDSFWSESHLRTLDYQCPQPLRTEKGGSGPTAPAVPVRFTQAEWIRRATSCGKLHGFLCARVLSVLLRCCEVGARGEPQTESA